MPGEYSDHEGIHLSPGSGKVVSAVMNSRSLAIQNPRRTPDKYADLMHEKCIFVNLLAIFHLQYLLQTRGPEPANPTWGVIHYRSRLPIEFSRSS